MNVAPVANDIASKPSADTNIVSLIADGSQNREPASAPKNLQPQSGGFIRKQTICVTLIILHFICGLLPEEERKKNKFLSLLT